MTKHYLGNSQINSIPELRVFFHNFQSYRRKRSRVQLARANIIHSQHEIDLEKLKFSISSEGTNTQKRPGS